MVNDNFSISYGEHNTDVANNAVDQEIESLQASYSMGGATLKIAETSWDNATYSSGTNREGTTVALSLAF